MEKTAAPLPFSPSSAARTGEDRKAAVVLIAEDDKDIANVTKILLEEFGYTILMASNGEETFELAAAQRPDLILLDIMMPRAHGFTICERIKSDPDLRRIKILMYSVKSYAEDRRLAQKLGADGFLVKPCDADTLLDRIHDLLYKKEAPDAANRDARRSGPLALIP